jgi:hypothetical protein
MTPRMPGLGRCGGCSRLLITDAYSMCWRCAVSVLEQPLPSQAHADDRPADFVERLYVDLGGGEGG